MATHTKSADQNINPLGGGGALEFAQNVRVSRVNLAYTDTTVTLGTFPAGATILEVKFVSQTDFNAGTNNFLDLGTTSGGAELVNDESIAALGVTAATLIGTAAYFSAETTVYATYVQSGTAATTGAGEVVVEWLPPVPT